MKKKTNLKAKEIIIKRFPSSDLFLMVKFIGVLRMWFIYLKLKFKKKYFLIVN